MAEAYIFAIDVGTSGLKAAIMDRNLNIVEYTQGHYSYNVVEILPEVVNF
jgi:sugar (pentulose or hexulose) kinase